VIPFPKYWKILKKVTKNHPTSVATVLPNELYINKKK
jgi:hypothetical protein